MPSLGAQNTILGLYLLNQPALTLIPSSVTGVYYSRLFSLPTGNIWYQINWDGNQSASSFENIDIDVRVRTGSGLPYNYQTQQPYGFNEFNALIESASPDVIDGILYRWTLNRALIGTTGTNITVNGNAMTNQAVFEYGTAYNTARIPNSLDSTWNFWSLPHLHPNSYISNNVNHPFLQLRITLNNFNPSASINPQMYNISVSSLLAQGN